MLRSMGTLASTLKSIRRDSGLTQSGLADKAGISQSTVSRIEGGVFADPGVAVLRAIADVLGVSIADLLPKSKPKKKRRIAA